jgi:carbon-monoxide dehydrogenase medium subunit
MKPAPFTYHSPATMAEALDLVATLENAKVLAGGQSLMPMINFRFIMPDHLIDLNRIAEMSAIERRGDEIFVGAMTRQHLLHVSPLIKQFAPLIPEAYDNVSHRQIRNRGTYGGSLCHLDPSSEQPCFTAALDGVIEVASRNGVREIPMAEWTMMYMTSALQEDELMTGARLSIWPQGHGWAFVEYARRHGDYAIVGVAVLVTVDAANRITRLAIAICGISAAPVRLVEAESALIGMVADEFAIEHASDLAEAIEDIMEDAHNSSDYRRHLTRVQTERALRLAFQRASQRTSSGNT